MAVYNGRQYIKEQLESIFNQTEKVDELVIVDDCSSTKCNDIIKSFQANERCCIKYVEHTENKGYAQTFFDALSLTTGDLIFLSDQDDIWDPQKVEKCERILSQNPNITCMSSCNTIINEKGIEIKREKRPKQKLTKIKFIDVIRQKNNGLRPGMSLVLRKELKNEINSINLAAIEMHDRLIEYISAKDGGYYLYNEYLNYYRIHNANTSGLYLSHFKLRAGKAERIDQIEKEIRYLDAIYGIDQRTKPIIDKCKEMYFIRKRLLLRNSIFLYILTTIMNIGKYSSVKVWLGDIKSIGLEKKEYKKTGNNRLA